MAADALMLPAVRRCFGAGVSRAFGRIDLMESRARYALIGLFTLAAMAGLLGFGLWFGSGGSTTSDIRILFDGKVSGLSRGSGVLFNGLRIGEVREVGFDPENPSRIYAVVRINRSAPVRRDTIARLEGQGLAGIVAVQLRGGEPNAPELVVQAGQTLPTIMAEPSPDIFEQARTIGKNVNDALDAIDDAVKTNQASVGETVKRVEQFSAMLADSAEPLDQSMKRAGEFANYLAPIPGKVGQLADDATALIRSYDRAYVTGLIDRSASLSGAVAAATDDVRTTVTALSSSSAKLDRAADNAEGALKAVQAFFDSAIGKDGRTIFTEVSEVARSMRDIAQSLDKRSAEIVTTINGFTRSSLQGIDAFVINGRSRLSGVGRTLRGVEKNPQSLLFGTKPQLPQYNGSR